MDKQRWQELSNGRSRLKRLKDRQFVARSVRDFFVDNDFLEVTAPLAVQGTCPDPGVMSLKTEEGYLTTSTEYHLKRLMVGGAEKVFSLTQNFRRGDFGVYHNPEFTMLEWGRVGATLTDIERDVEEIVRASMRVLGLKDEIIFANKKINFTGPWLRVSVQDALAQFLKIEVDEYFEHAHLLEQTAKRNIVIPETLRTNRLDTLSFLLDSLQSHLGESQPLFLVEWPAFMTPSADVYLDRPHLAQRSELFIAGIEVADGFPFLTDAQKQTENFAHALAERKTMGADMVELDMSFIKSLHEGLLPGAGMALGFDRLVMLLTNGRALRDVMAFTWNER